jgi:16S rRNA (uracil1498-N3)-methyltransferase
MGHRCYLPPSTLEPEVEHVEIGGDEAHHLIKVLRCRVGEPLDILDGHGGIARSEITHIDRRTLQARILARETVAASPAQFTLIQAIPKGKRQDLVLQKAVELGVHRIVFVQTEHVVSRVRPDEAQDKLNRWNQILIGSLKQSGNPWVPDLTLAWNWEEVLRRESMAMDAVFLADLSSDAKNLKDTLSGYTDLRKIACCIGPEGDFTPGEIAVARAAGAIPINLGPRVLRTETAALYLMSVFAYEFLN